MWECVRVWECDSVRVWECESVTVWECDRERRRGLTLSLWVMASLSLLVITWSWMARIALVSDFIQATCNKISLGFMCQFSLAIISRRGISRSRMSKLKRRCPVKSSPLQCIARSEPKGLRAILKLNWIAEAMTGCRSYKYFWIQSCKTGSENDEVILHKCFS